MLKTQCDAAGGGRTINVVGLFAIDEHAVARFKLGFAAVLTQVCLPGTQLQQEQGIEAAVCNVRRRTANRLLVRLDYVQRRRTKFPLVKPRPEAVARRALDVDFQE